MKEWRGTPARVSSSTTTVSWTKVPPPPPYSAGTSLSAPAILVRDEFGLDERADRCAERPERVSRSGSLGERNHDTRTRGWVARWTPATARPDGSAALANSGSQVIATGEEQAIDGPPGTVRAQQAPGNARVNTRRYRSASFVCGGSVGYCVAARASSASRMLFSACPFSASIQP